MKKFGLAVWLLAVCISPLPGQSKHSRSSNFPSYEGRVMCGYQGWFRAEGDGSGQGWAHYSERGPQRVIPGFGVEIQPGDFQLRLDSESRLELALCFEVTWSNAIGAGPSRFLIRLSTHSQDLRIEQNLPGHSLRHTE